MKNAEDLASASQRLQLALAEFLEELTVARSEFQRLDPRNPKVSTLILLASIAQGAAQQIEVAVGAILDE